MIGGQRASGKAADEDRKEEKGSQIRKGDEVEQFLLEKPVHHRPRILAAPIDLTGAYRVHLCSRPCVASPE